MVHAIDVLLTIILTVVTGVGINGFVGRVENIFSEAFYHPAFAQFLAEYQVERWRRAVIKVRGSIKLYLYQPCANHVKAGCNIGAAGCVSIVQVSVDGIRRLFKNRAGSRRAAVIDARSS